MKLPIITEPNPLLRRVGKQLTAGDLLIPQTQKLIDDLLDTLYASKDGVGLAAPQVGQSVQICVIAKNFTADKKADVVLVNPQWEKMSILKITDTEGCLSVPDIYGDVKRYKKIRVRALDRAGRPIQFLAENFFARIVQHETDHLNGVLFIDKAKNLRQIDERL